MSTTEIDRESRSRIPLPRREDLNSEGQKIFDYFTSGSKGVLRGLHGPAGIWLHEPKLAEVYVASAMPRDCGFDQIIEDRAQLFIGGGLVFGHHQAVADDVGGHDRG